MTATETDLAVRIANYRTTISKTTGSQDTVTVGVARFHAADMAKNRYVGLVASDGEDPFRRITCSNVALASKQTAIIAVGYSTDYRAVFNALIADFGVLSIFADNTFGTSLSVGYSDGYWMIIFQ